MPCTAASYVIEQSKRVSAVVTEMLLVSLLNKKPCSIRQHVPECTELEASISAQSGPAKRCSPETNTNTRCERNIHLGILLPASTASLTRDEQPKVHARRR